MSWRLSKGEWLAILITIVITFWYFGKSKPSVPPPSKPTPQTSSGTLVQSSALLTGLPTGPTIISRDGDPCQTLKKRHDSHPAGYGPGFTTEEVKLYCRNASGNYALDNVGIYQNKKLVSSRRQMIPDGQCKFVRTQKTLVKSDNDIPAQDTAGLEYRMDSFVCYLKGELVLDNVIGVYKNDKPISLRVRVRNLASVLQHARKAK